jgi:hypothetical protein
MIQKRLLQAAVMVSLAITLTGCSQQVSHENWERIEIGESTKTDVVALMGDPWQQTDLAWVYSDDDRHITAFVYFEDETVSGKTWECPQHGMEGESPLAKKGLSSE